MTQEVQRKYCEQVTNQGAAEFPAQALPASGSKREKKGGGEGSSGEKQINRMITHSSFVLCTAGPSFSAWVQTEAFPCYLKK